MSAPAVKLVPDVADEAGGGARPGSSGAIVALELLLILLVIRLFRIEEQRGLFALVCLAAVGFMIHRRLPLAWRPAWFLAVSMASFPLAFAWPHAGADWIRAATAGLSQSAWVFGLGAGLIALCHVPVPFTVRAGLLVAAGAGLFWWRDGAVDPFWPVLGSLFMFRLWLYVTELRREKQPVSWPTRLSYFFLLPNAFFPFFPIIDYRRFLAARRPDEDGRVAQQGVAWILRGLLHLLLHRVIKIYQLPGLLDLIDAEYIALLLVTNYALYLRISGYFHIITGLLHLFGFDLPRTHDRYFLASSLSDIWRRINIYWKDFLTDHVFLPTFFALRRWPRWAAIVAGVAAVFVATWLLHSWQAFWLLGDFPLAGRDAALWLSAGALVAINSLWQYRAAARHETGPAELTPTLAVRRSLQIAGTFLAVSFFWACWRYPGFPALMAAVASIGGFAPRHLLLPVGVLLAAVAVGALVQLATGREGSSRLVLRDLLEHSTAACLLSLAALVVVGTPQVYEKFGHDAAVAISRLQASELTAAEVEQELSGYYEELADASLQSDPLGGSSRRLPPGGSDPYDDATRPHASVLQVELIPGWRGRVEGVPFVVNRWGMRDDDVSRRKPPGTYRVAVLGTSVTMGYGIPADEDFESLLERRLNENADGRRVELLNFAAGTYSALHQAAMLREKAFAFEPDAVYFIAHQAEYHRPPGHVAGLAVTGYPLPYPCLDEIVREAGVAVGTSPVEAELRLRPHAIPLLKCVYGGLVADCRRRGVVPVWVYVPVPSLGEPVDDFETVSALAREAGFAVVDLSDWAGGRAPEAVRLGGSDPYHLNAAAHRLIADRLYQALGGRPEVATP